MNKENIQISLDFSFEAAHFMPNFPEKHPNRKIHGHSYQATVTLSGPIDINTGVFVEYSEFKSVGDAIVEKLDHQMLNEFPMLELPTSENICRYLWNEFSAKLPGVFSIEIKRPTLGLKIIYFGPNN